ncbi:MAG: nucleoside hydrolase [Chloroflexi bacterium]|nr:MAG: nucleoside hydrolase [Chloroflexota bacterium]
MAPLPKPRTVLFDHDGGVDDLLSLVMLLSMPHISLAGVVVTPADCFLRPALSATLKILRFFNRLDVEVSCGDLHGVNAFPRAWRAHAYAVDMFPILNEVTPDTPDIASARVDSEPGHSFLARKLRQSRQPVTVLMTGPATNLAAALHAQPELAANIEEVVWMGGALNVPGNVKDYEHDGSAEWNSYWDPPAAHRLWQTGVPITLFPLDATNLVDVSTQFLNRLAQQRRYPVSDLAGQCWALTVGVIPAYEYIYHMWDTLTTGYLGAPHCITFRKVQTQVTPAGPSAGRIAPVESGGKIIRAAEHVDVPKFHNYLLELFKQ